MRSGTGESSQQPVFVTNVTGAGGAIAAGTPADPVFTQTSTLPASTDRSGTATTTSGGLTVPANTGRRGLVGQNISAVTIGFNEQGLAAAIGTPGTYTVPAGSSFAISTNKTVNFISAGPGTAAVTMTEF